jgi:hypothetical protein
MKPRTIVVVVLMCLFTLTLCFAESPMMGTWKLNEAKSKYGPGVPRGVTVVYEASGDSIKCTIDGVDAQGKPTRSEWIGKFDGKDYPVTGDTTNARSVKKVNDYTYDVTLKEGGKVTMSGRIAIAENGKTRTVTLHSTDPNGEKVTSKFVYDKQ